MRLDQGQRLVLRDHGEQAGRNALQLVGACEDGRRVRLDITERTRKELTELSHAQQQINDMMFSEFSARDFKGLAKGVDLLVESCDSAVRLSSYIATSQPKTSQK